MVFKLWEKKYFNKLINIGHEEEITIGQLANKINKLVGFNGELIYTGKYSGVNRKCLNSNILLKKLKRKNKFDLDKGLTKVYEKIIHN